MDMGMRCISKGRTSDLFVFFLNLLYSYNNGISTEQHEHLTFPKSWEEIWRDWGEGVNGYMVC